MYLTRNRLSAASLNLHVIFTRLRKTASRTDNSLLKGIMIFKSSLRDIRRVYGNVTLLTHIYRLKTIPSYRIIWLFRLIGDGKKSIFNRILYYYYIRFSRKCLIELHPRTIVGIGIQFPHNGPIVINPSAIIGEDCIIHPCVLIGGDRKTGSPIIGNNCFIGHGSKLIGKIKIGENVFIAPGAILTKDISDNSVVGSGYNNIIKHDGGKVAVNRYQSKKL